MIRVSFRIVERFECGVGKAVGKAEWGRRSGEGKGIHHGVTERKEVNRRWTQINADGFKR